MLVEFAAVDPLDRNTVEVDTLQAPDVHGPSGELRCAGCDFLRRSVARPPERKDAARGAEVVLGRARVPLIQREVFEGRQQPQLLGLDSMDQRAALPTDRAVARSDVIELEINLEAGAATVARALVCLHAAQRMAAKLRPRVRLPRFVSSTVARIAKPAADSFSGWLGRMVGGNK